MDKHTSTVLSNALSNKGLTSKHNILLDISFKNQIFYYYHHGPHPGTAMDDPATTLLRPQKPLQKPLQKPPRKPPQKLLRKPLQKVPPLQDLLRPRLCKACVRWIKGARSPETWLPWDNANRASANALQGQSGLKSAARRGWSTTTP